MYNSICIVGPGAVGLFLAGLFADKASVYLLGRKPVSTELKNKPIILKKQIESTTSHELFNWIEPKDLNRLPKDTHYWITTKAYDLNDAINTLSPFLNANTTVVLCQNGFGIYLDAAFIIKRRAPLCRLLISVGLNKLGALEVEVNGQTKMVLSSPDEFSKERDCIKKILESSDVDLIIETNVALSEWRKILLNLVVNPITALTETRNIEVATNPELRDLAIKILAEASQVAAKEGFSIKEISSGGTKSTLEAEIFEKIKNCGDNYCSTLLDIKSNRKTEIEYIIGRIIKLGKSYNVPTPTLETLYGLVKAKSNHSH